MGNDLVEDIMDVMRDIEPFCRQLSGLHLRSYQLQAARAIVNSAIREQGLSFVVIFPRQSGKNELQAQIEAYLLAMCSTEPSEIVKVSPTWKPQSLNAMRRLERVLKHNLVCNDRWVKRSGYIYQYGEALMHFLSGAPVSSIVGATASLLLECDEAQDVSLEKWDKEIAPMAASTNATRVFWGTAWTSHTLLARELRLARQAEAEDGIQRAWVLTADQVGAEVPAYRRFVEEQVARLGRNHPLVRTQYYSEEIDSDGGMFPLRRRMLMLGSHAMQSSPQPGEAYAFTIDVAGEDEAASAAGSTGSLAVLANPGRDSTVLTIFRLELSSLADPLLNRPTYQVVQRLAWQGVRHSLLYGSLLSLVETWAPLKVIIDATGVGAGLAGFLRDRLGTRLLPFEFSQASKSTLGWDFLTLVETGRFKEFHPLDPEMSRQLEQCQYTILEGPGKLMRWGVPEGRRDPANGDMVHDDYLISAALVSLLDAEPWGTARSQVIHAADPLAGLRF